jgi:hypothetical protein
MTNNEVFLEEDVKLTKKGTIRRRKEKKKNTYFTQETEDMILKWRNENSEYIRNEIYRTKIHHAFYKLAENIIHSFKFYYIDTNSIEDLKYEVISFLLQKIHLYDQSKGKAYSYFGTITKRYLISYNQKNYKKLVSKVELSEIHNDETTVDTLIEKKSEIEVDKDELFYRFLDEMDLKCLDIFTEESDIKVAISLLEIFKKAKDMESVNKKLIFYCAKEMTGASTNTITKVIKKFKTYYKTMLLEEMDKIKAYDIYSY